MEKAIFPPEISVEAVQKNTQGLFSETMGVKFTEIGRDFVKARLTVDQRHLRTGGIMNGGVSLALMEIVGSVACNLVIRNQGKNNLGIQLNANHLAIAKPGDVLTITASPVHLGKSTHLWQIDISNDEGRMVSTGRLTLLIVEAKK